MNLAELRKNRFFVVFEALLKGIQIEYKNKWYLFISNGQLYQTFYNKILGKQITHKSVLTLQSFLEKFDKIPDKELKQIYAAIKLKDFQRKILDNNKE